MSVFDEVKSEQLPEPHVLTAAYNADSFPLKVYLVIGAYRTEENKPWVLPLVREIEKKISVDQPISYPYKPTMGLESFTLASLKLLLGTNSVALKEKRVVGVQTLGGSGALRIGAEFLSKVLKCSTIYFSQPTWETHKFLFTKGGFKNLRFYRYWDSNTKNLDLAGMLEDIKNAPQNSVILLQASAHNPTGLDPTQEQWKQIAKVIQKKKLLSFFDLAYQGFASGNLEEDAWAVRYFEKEGLEFLCAQSFSKNFGLYNERVGNLAIVTNRNSNLSQMLSQISLIIRANYSSPPLHGAKIVENVLNDPLLYSQWIQNVRTMSDRIKLMQKELYDNLVKLGARGSWEHILNQKGMFSYTGLTEKQIYFLRDTFHIYMLKSGRANMCGLNSSNLDYVAKGIYEALLQFPS